MTGKKNLLARVLRYSGANRLLQSAGTGRGLLVLNYHRVGNPHGTLLDHGVWSASEEQFTEQLRIAKLHADVIGLKDLDRALLDRRGRYVLITFDDGYRDNYEQALPILKSQRVPATFFITTGFLDEGRVAWWDDIAWMVRTSLCSGLRDNGWTGGPLSFDEPHREQAIARLLAVYKSLPGDRTSDFLTFLAVATGSSRCPLSRDEPTWMTWEMVREMRRSGMDIGGHTVTHPILARLTAEQQWREVSECKARIEAELGEPIEAFSYPVGAPDCFDDTTRSCLERAEYRWAFSFSGGFTAPGAADRFNLPRVAIYPQLSATRLQGLLTLPQVFS